MALLTRLCFLSHPCVKVSQNFKPKPLLLFQPAANMSTILTQVLASSVAIADKAGEIVRDIWKNGDLGIVEKTGKDDLQTQADRSAQNCIIASLAKQFPQLKVVGEEGEQDLSDVPADWIVAAADKEAAKVTCPDKYKNVAMEDLTVWVDPLDGTKEYTQVLQIQIYKSLLVHCLVITGFARPCDCLDWYSCRQGVCCWGHPPAILEL